MTKGTLLAAVGLSRRYRRWSGGWSGGRGPVEALKGVTLKVTAGETLAVVGPSGAGKSTLARLLAGVELPDEGSITVDGRVMSPGPERSLKLLRQTVQLVFQDPGLSLNPRQRVGAAAREPLVIRGCGRRELAQRGRELFDQVGLPGSETFAKRWPRDLSGGERQRVALARALACDPAILVLDEPTAALDASMRGQVVNVLQSLNRARKTALVLITHDVGLAAFLCERVVVLYDGAVVEDGATATVLGQPRHSVTAALVVAARGACQRAEP